MDKINVKNDKDLILFNHILGDIISMLFGDKDQSVNAVFSDKVLSRIKCLDIFDWNYKDDELNEFSHGNTKFSSDGKTGIKMYGLEGKSHNTRYIEQIFSHELWRAIMVIVNNIYGSCFKRDVFYDDCMFDVSNYSGFLRCSTGDYEFTPGYYIVDSLTQMLALSVVNKRNDPNFSMDELFKNPIDDEVLSSPTDDLLTFFQLFVSAFNLSSDNWMDKNYLINKGLLESYESNSTGHVLQNNIFISESIRNPISVMDEFDKYEGKGTYISVLARIDTLYRKYLEEGIVDSKEFIRVSRILKHFIYTRLYNYLDKSLITSDDFSELTGIFNAIYSRFMSEIRVYKIKSAKRKFKKRVKNLVNKRIK